MSRSADYEDGWLDGARAFPVKRPGFDYFEGYCRGQVDRLAAARRGQERAGVEHAGGILFTPSVDSPR